MWKSEKLSNWYMIILLKIMFSTERHVIKSRTIFLDDLMNILFQASLFFERFLNDLLD